MYNLLCFVFLLFLGQHLDSFRVRYLLGPNFEFPSSSRVLGFSYARASVSLSVLLKFLRI